MNLTSVISIFGWFDGDDVVPPSAYSVGGVATEAGDFVGTEGDDFVVAEGLGVPRSDGPIDIEAGGLVSTETGLPVVAEAVDTDAAVGSVGTEDGGWIASESGRTLVAEGVDLSPPGIELRTESGSTILTESGAPITKEGSQVPVAMVPGTGVLLRFFLVASGDHSTYSQATPTVVLWSPGRGEWFTPIGPLTYSGLGEWQVEATPADLEGGPPVLLYATADGADPTPAWYYAGGATWPPGAIDPPMQIWMGTSDSDGYQPATGLTLSVMLSVPGQPTTAGIGTVAEAGNGFYLYSPGADELALGAVAMYATGDGAEPWRWLYEVAFKLVPPVSSAGDGLATEDGAILTTEDGRPITPERGSFSSYVDPFAGTVIEL